MPCVHQIQSERYRERSKFILPVFLAADTETNPGGMTLLRNGARHERRDHRAEWNCAHSAGRMEAWLCGSCGTQPGLDALLVTL
eukprot:364884-Chlamydomonas_euryale.AAC.3